MIDNIWDSVLNDINLDEDSKEDSVIGPVVTNSHVYLIITDLHLSYKNKNSRVDYLAETKYCVNVLNEIINYYKDNDNKVFLLFLGDFTDCSFKDQARAIEINNLVVDFKRRVEECYFVIGNHETTYYKDNPLWSLFDEIESVQLNQIIKKSCKPQGILSLGRVVDELEDGNVRFLFNHFDTPVISAKPDEKINIGLFHKDILCNAIINDSKINHNMNLFADKTIHFDKEQVFTNYDYAFMGHLHSVYGKWDFIDDATNKKTVVNYLASLGRTNHTEVSNDFLERNIPAVIIKDGEFKCIEDNFTNKKTVVNYLASLGRTNHTEVSNDFLERNIPAVIIKDGEFKCIEDNLFDLMRREDCVIEEIVQKQQEIREASKENKELLEYFSPNDNEPIDNILSTLSRHPFMQNLFEEYLNDNESKVEDNIKERLEEVKWL